MESLMTRSAISATWRFLRGLMDDSRVGTMYCSMEKRMRPVTMPMRKRMESTCLQRVEAVRG